MKYNQRLKMLREDRNLTQMKLGEVLNYGSSAIANYESGRNQPSIPDLIKIADYFDVTLDYLTGRKDTLISSDLTLSPKEMKQIGKSVTSELCEQEDALEIILQPIVERAVAKYISIAQK